MAYMMLYRRLLKPERGKYFKGMKKIVLRCRECVMKLMRVFRSGVVLPPKHIRLSEK